MAGSGRANVRWMTGAATQADAIGAVAVVNGRGRWRKDCRTHSSCRSTVRGSAPQGWHMLHSRIAWRARFSSAGFRGPMSGRTSPVVSRMSCAFMRARSLRACRARRLPIGERFRQRPLGRRDGGKRARTLRTALSEGWSQRTCAIAAGHRGSQPAVTAIGTTPRRACLRPSSGHDRLPEPRRLVPLSLVRVQVRPWAPRVLWSRWP